jgi:8-oxo-dGTP pyrophosphatase MutT (NUDIX family)
MSDDQAETIHPWRILHSERVLDNHWAKVRKDSCELESGLTVPDYYYWEGGDFALIFALTVSGEVLLTRQYKHGVKEITLELPAGLIDSADESSLAAAQRELREETGYAGGEWRSLGELNISSAKSTTRASAFLARNVEMTGAQKLDRNERIECVSANLAELMRLIEDRTIHDAPSIATIFLALRALGYGLVDREGRVLGA